MSGVLKFTRCKSQCRDCVVFRCVCSSPLQSAWDATGSGCVQGGKCPCKLKDPGQQGTEKTTEKRERSGKTTTAQTRLKLGFVSERRCRKGGLAVTALHSLSLSLKLQSIEIQTSAPLLFFPLLCGYTLSHSHTPKPAVEEGKKNPSAWLWYKLLIFIPL